MKKPAVPARDTALSPLGGTTRDGQPLSRNRGARPELTPWIARLYVSDVDAPADHRLTCGLLNDTSFLRIQLRGHWRALTADGPMERTRSTLFFGPQSRMMPVTVTGPFCSIGISLRPGACHALRGPKAAEMLDRVLPLEEASTWTIAGHDDFDPEMSAEEIMVRLEDMLARAVDRAGGREPDPLTLRFEAATFADPNLNVGDFARECGVDQRQLERVVRRDFGLPPKQVLRRARALDMGSHLRGVADAEEAEELMLRYYDQSHLHREFAELFGMTPSQFVARPQPLLTLALESRQARRLEAMARIAPGAARPWQ